MAEKVTWMLLKVDLQCPCCYKKVKKILCKFPQIRDQVYDVQKNLVKITVVCCSPEKIRDKLCCKGGKVIKSIEILEPPKPKPPPAEKPKPPPPEKPKPPPPAEKPKPPPPAEKPKEPPAEKPKPPPAEKPKEPPAEKPKPPPAEKPKEPAPAPPPPVVILPPPPPVVPAPADPYPVPVGFCCPECYHGHGGGPCYAGYGRPVPPPPCYDNYYYGYGYKGSYPSRCDCFSEENPSACRIM